MLPLLLLIIVFKLLALCIASSWKTLNANQYLIYASKEAYGLHLQGLLTQSAVSKVLGSVLQQPESEVLFV